MILPKGPGRSGASQMPRQTECLVYLHVQTPTPATWWFLSSSTSCCGPNLSGWSSDSVAMFVTSAGGLCGRLPVNLSRSAATSYCGSSVFYIDPAAQLSFILTYHSLELLASSSYGTLWLLLNKYLNIVCSAAALLPRLFDPTYLGSTIDLLPIRR